MCYVKCSVAEMTYPIPLGKRWNLLSMTVKIRLKRTGKTKAPSYRVVVAEARSPRDGRIIENIGWYNPRVEPSAININEERALNWLQHGAQPTDSVEILLKRSGILDRWQQSKSSSQAEAAQQAQ